MFAHGLSNNRAALPTGSTFDAGYEDGSMRRRLKTSGAAAQRASAPRPRVDNAMVKALARAFRWRKMLDDGVHATLEDLARAKSVNATYVSRLLRLTLLAPEIVEAILDGRQPAELQLEGLPQAFPSEWAEQGRHLRPMLDVTFRL